jgi:hypothetical protein
MKWMLWSIRENREISLQAKVDLPDNKVGRITGFIQPVRTELAGGITRELGAVLAKASDERQSRSYPPRELHLEFRLRKSVMD